MFRLFFFRVGWEYLIYLTLEKRFYINLSSFEHRNIVKRLRQVVFSRYRNKLYCCILLYFNVMVSYLNVKGNKVS